jgi:glycosyltransferase involved in cell wall biosynthesis
MRVLHVIANLEAKAGGPPKTAAALAAAQAAAGADTGILYHGPAADAEGVRRTYRAVPGLDRVQLLPVGPATLPELALGGRARAGLRAFAPDVLHLHGVWEPLLRHAGRWARATATPYVMITHSMLDPWHQRHHRAAKWILFNLLGWRSLMNHALFQQALTAFERDYIAALGLGRRFEVVANGIFPAEIHAHPTQSPDEILPALNGRPYVVSMARLHPQKGLDVLLDAFIRIAGRLPDLCLVLAGADYGQGARLRASVQQAGLDDRVLFPGLLPQSDVWPVLAGARAFCLPSRAEGFSLALLEAALAGAPMIITPGCHFDELAAAGAARLVPLEAERLADALLEIAASPSARETMGAAGRRLVLEHYTWDAVARRLLALYESGSKGA